MRFLVCFVTIILPIHQEFLETEVGLRDRIIDVLNIKEMKKTELCRYLGYERIVNSVNKQLESLKKEGIVEKQDNIYRLK